jgi:hypothetical protein
MSDAGAAVPERPRDGALEPWALIDELLRESGA